MIIRLLSQERAELRNKRLYTVGIYAVRDSHAAAVTTGMVEPLYESASSDTWCLADTGPSFIAPFAIVSHIHNTRLALCVPVHRTGPRALAVQATVTASNRVGLANGVLSHREAGQESSNQPGDEHCHRLREHVETEL